MSAISEARALQREALRTRLWDTAGIPALRDMENMKFDLRTVTPGSTWIRERTQFDGGRYTGLGSSAGIPVRHAFSGAYLLDVFFPYKTGTVGADTLIGAIQGQFAPGSTLTAGAVQVLIGSCTVSSAADGDGWYMVSLTISWTSDVIQ